MREYKNIYITVKSFPGSAIHETCTEIVLLAQSMNICVETKFNSVKIMATPDALAEDLANEYYLNINRGRLKKDEHKY